MATLAAKPLRSVERYLRTSYRPDRDFVDGVTRGRNRGEYEHSAIQTELAFLFTLREKEWGIFAGISCRIQIGPERFRVADIVVLRETQKVHRIIREAPLLCIEVLDSKDRWEKMSVRLDDYVALGVEHIWCFNSETREVRRYSALGYEVVTEPLLTVQGTPIQITIADVFAALGPC